MSSAAAPDPFASAHERVAAKDLAERLRLHPLPEEGGLFRETHRDAHSSAIYFMLIEPMVSALHRLNGDEVYHWYAGSPLDLLLLHPDGRSERVLLGADVLAGQHPQFRVPAGAWQGSSSTGAWTLVGTTMAPPFDWHGFELADVEALVARHPKAAARIRALAPR